VEDEAKDRFSLERPALRARTVRAASWKRGGMEGGKGYVKEGTERERSSDEEAIATH